MGEVPMAFFDDLCFKLSKAGQSTMQKANNLADTAKLSMRANELNRIMHEHYAELGERYYALHGTEPEEELAELCNRLNEINSELQEVRVEIQRIKQIKVCPNCGNENPSDAHFCNKCSAALPDLPPRLQNAERGRTCPACGAAASGSALFCTACGAKLDIDSEE